MKKMIKFFSIFLLLILGVSITSCNLGKNNNKNAPVFDSIKIMEESPISPYTLSNDDIIDNNDSEYGIQSLKKDNIGNKPSLKPIIPPHDDMFDDDDDDDDDIEDILPAPEVAGPEKDIYYSAPNKDVFIAISVINPKSYAILRFTLNGEVYQSYQFEKGSTSTLIVLKVNSGELPGIKEFTLDEMKYIEDESNEPRDVIIKGRPNVKLQVSYDNIPYVEMSNETISLNSYSAHFNVVDKEKILKDNSDLKINLSDGKKIVHEVKLNVGSNIIKFDNLMTGLNYQYMITANFDDLSIDGLRRHVLFKKDFTTTNAVKVSNIFADKTTISFDYQVINTSINIDDIILFDNQGNAISKVENGLNKFIELYSGVKYELRFYYTLKVDNKDLVLYDKVFIKTKNVAVPKLSVIYNVVDTELSFDINIDDDDNVLTLNSIKLYTAKGEFIKNVALDAKVINGLNRNVNYELRVGYSYDLNDGKGVINDIKVTPFTTDKAVPKVDIVPYTTSNDSIEFDVIVTDPNNVGHLQFLRLYKKSNNALIENLTNLSLRKFSNLTADTVYYIEAGYVYDLNDGNGSQLITFTSDVSTSKIMPSLDINLTANKDSININTTIDDKNNAGKLIKYEIYLENELVLTIDNPKNNQLVDNLLSGFNYRVKAIYEYDLKDMSGTHILEEEKQIQTFAKKVPTINIGINNNSYNSFKYYFNNTDEDKILTIDQIKLLLGSNVVKEFNYDDIKEFSFDNLYSNNNYTIEVLYHYDLNDGSGDVHAKFTKNIKTKKHDNIVYEYDKMLAGKDFINFGYKIKDEDGLSQIKSIEIYQDNVLIQSLQDLSLRKFENLDEESFYTIKTTYTYNLNDGKGDILDAITILYGTSGSKLFVNNLEVINNQTPSVGEKVQVQIDIDNPYNLKITNIYISGVKARILNNTNNFSRVICEFEPETLGGYYNVEVTGYEYETNGIQLTESLTSPYSKEIIVLGDLKVLDFYPLSDSKYGGLSQQFQFILEIDNPTGYKINYIEVLKDTNNNFDSVIKSYDFKLLDNNHILLNLPTYIGNSYLRYAIVSGINYQLDSCDPITKRFDARISSIRLYDKVIHIKTVEDLLNISKYNKSNYYILDNDLDLNGLKWEGIKGKGYFNGNNHTIKNVTISIQNESTNTQYYGLFSSFEGTIHDLNLKDIFYSVKTKGHTVLAGVSAYNSSIINCSVSGTIMLDGPGYALGIGSASDAYYKVGKTQNCLVKDLVIDIKNGAKGYLITRIPYNKSYSLNQEGQIEWVNQPYKISLDCSVVGNSCIRNANNILSFYLHEYDNKEYGGILNGIIENTEYTIVTNIPNMLDIKEEAAYLNSVNINRKGYFAEWYDNPNFNGKKIEFPYVNPDNPIIYAKWIKISIANPNYTYHLSSYYDNITQQYIPGYRIKDFGKLAQLQKDFVVGGYYNGLPVIGVDHNATHFITHELDENGYYVEKSNAQEIVKEYNFYVLDTIKEQHNLMGNIYHTDNVFYDNISYYNSTKQYFNEKYKSIIDEKYGNTYYYQFINFYNDNDNPFDKLVDYVETDENNITIDLTVTDIKNIEKEYKYVPENLKYQIIEENGFKFYIVNGTKVLNYKNQLYKDVKNVHKDDSFIMVEYNNGSFEVIDLLNKNLTSVDFTKYNYKITKLADHLFEDSNLNKVILPNDLEEIGCKTFANSAIKQLVMPDSVIKMGEGAFEGCIQLQYVKLSNNLKVISKDAFKDNNNLSSIVLPNGLEEIGENAFLFGYSLREVVIPNSVVAIHKRAYYYCSGIESFYIPSSVKYIGESAIYNPDCTVIPETNIFIEMDKIPQTWEDNFAFNITFYYNIKEIKNNEKFKYAVKHNNEIIIRKQITEDFIVSEDLSSFVEGTVVEICGEAFIKGKELVLPNSITKIGFGAFSSECSNYIYIPSSVTELAERAIQSNLHIYTEFNNIPSGWNSSYLDYDIDFSIVGIKQNTNFKYLINKDDEVIILECVNKNLVSTDFDGLKVIKLSDNLFNSNKNIRNVYLPDTLKEIGDSTFYKSGIVSITFPDSLEKIGSFSFADCYDLSTVIMNDNLKVIPSYAFRDAQVSKFKLPNNLIEIEDYGFSINNNNSTLNTIELPKTLTKLGQNSLPNCKYLYITSNIIYLGSQISYCNKILIEDNQFKPNWSINAFNDNAEIFFDIKKITEENNFIIGTNINNEITIIEQINLDINEALNLNFLDGILVNISSDSIYNSDYDLILPNTVNYIGVNGIRNFKNIFIPSSVTIIKSQGLISYYSNAKIYTDCSNKPDTWNEKFYNDYCTVIWGATIDQMK